LHFYLKLAVLYRKRDYGRKLPKHVAIPVRRIGFCSTDSKRFVCQVYAVGNFSDTHVEGIWIQKGCSINNFPSQYLRVL
jgi:hypothetical protein